MTDLVDGQIYRWRWSDKLRDADNAPYRSYHCKSQIAIVRNGGRLYDTFWGDFTHEGELDPSKVDLTLWGDEAWEKISEYQIIYYVPEDVVSLRHSNNSHAPIYLRPGAVRNVDTILNEIIYREQKARSEIRYATNLLERLSDARALLGDGKINEVSL